MNLTATIVIPWDGHTRRLDRDQLQTAYLYYLDVLTDGHNGIHAVKETADRLDMDAAVPNKDRTILAVAARICHDSNIEP